MPAGARYLKIQLQRAVIERDAIGQSVLKWEDEREPIRGEITVEPEGSTAPEATQEHHSRRLSVVVANSCVPHDIASASPSHFRLRTLDDGILWNLAAVQRSTPPRESRGTRRRAGWLLTLNRLETDA